MRLPPASLALALLACALCAHDVVGDVPSVVAGDVQSFELDDGLVADIDPNALVTGFAFNGAGHRDTEGKAQHGQSRGQLQKRQQGRPPATGGFVPPEGSQNQQNSGGEDGSMPFHPPRNHSAGNRSDDVRPPGQRLGNRSSETRPGGGDGHYRGNTTGPGPRPDRNRTVPGTSGNFGSPGGHRGNNTGPGPRPDRNKTAPGPGHDSSTVGDTSSVASDPAYLLQIRATVSYTTAELQDEGLRRSLRQAVALSASVDVARVMLLVQGSERRHSRRQTAGTYVNFTIDFPSEEASAAAAATVTTDSVNAKLADLQLRPVTSLEASTTAFVRTPIGGLPPPPRSNHSRNASQGPPDRPDQGSGGAGRPGQGSGGAGRPDQGTGGMGGGRPQRPPNATQPQPGAGPGRGRPNATNASQPTAGEADHRPSRPNGPRNNTNSTGSATGGGGGGAGGQISIQPFPATSGGGSANQTASSQRVAGLRLRAKLSYTVAQLQDAVLRLSLRVAVALAAGVNVSRVDLTVEGSSSRRDGGGSTQVSFTVWAGSRAAAAALATSLTGDAINEQLAAQKLQPMTEVAAPAVVDNGSGSEDQDGEGKDGDEHSWAVAVGAGVGGGVGAMAAAGAAWYILRARRAAAAAAPAAKRRGGDVESGWEGGRAAGDVEVGVPVAEVVQVRAEGGSEAHVLHAHVLPPVGVAAP